MSAPTRSSAFQQNPTHQYGTSGYPSSLSTTPAPRPAQSSYQSLQPNALPEHPSYGSRNETPVEQQLGTPTCAPSWFFIQWQSLYQFLRLNALTGHRTPVDQYSTPVYALSWSLIPAQSLYQFLQPYVLTEHQAEYPPLAFGCVHETPLEQHGTPAPSWFSIPAQSLYQFLQSYAATECHETLAGQHGTPTSPPSWFRIPAQSLYQFLQLCVLTENPSSGSGQETSANQPSTPAFPPLQSVMPAQSQYQFSQSHAPTEHPSLDSEHETPAGQRVGYTQSRSVTPTLSQDQVNVRPNEPTPSIPPECPICGKHFSGSRERNRHLKSYLPHSIYCPSKDCPWTGRRRFDLKIHWGKKHSEIGRSLGKEKYELYDPRAFVKSILDGTSNVEVAWSAYKKVQGKLMELGKIGVGANVLGRKLDIES